jgi:hypothetical protein
MAGLTVRRSIPCLGPLQDVANRAYQPVIVEPSKPFHVGTRPLRRTAMARVIDCPWEKRFAI